MKTPKDTNSWSLLDLLVVCMSLIALAQVGSNSYQRFLLFVSFRFEPMIVLPTKDLSIFSSKRWLCKLWMFSFKLKYEIVLFTMILSVHEMIVFMWNQVQLPVSVVRLMRAFRVIRLFGRFKSLKKTVSALLSSLIPVTNAFIIIFVISSICKIVVLIFLHWFSFSDIYTHIFKEAW